MNNINQTVGLVKKLLHTGLFILIVSAQFAYTQSGFDMELKETVIYPASDINTILKLSEPEGIKTLRANTNANTKVVLDSVYEIKKRRLQY